MSTAKFTRPQIFTTGVASLVSLAFLGTNPAQAQIVNGSFETGDFSGFNTIGNTSIETAAFGSSPTEKDFQALLTTGENSVSDAAIESFLGLSSGSLDALSTTTPSGGTVTEGSALSQSFTAQAGDILAFDFNFLTNEATPTSFNDLAFVSIAGLDVLADTNATFVNSLTPFFEETGFGTFSFTLPTAGTFTLGVGVVDEGDTLVSSGLLVDNISVTERVPEPASLLGLLAVSILGVGSLKRKQKQET